MSAPTSDAVALAAPVTNSGIHGFIDGEYRYGFSTDLDTEIAPKGLNEDIVRLISAKKAEPEWLLEWRLAAYRHFVTLDEPTWPNVHHEAIDYQAMSYWAAPKPMGSGPDSLDDVDPMVRVFDKLGIYLAVQERLSGVAVDAIIDSVSVATTFKTRLAEVGVIFCFFSDAVQNHPDVTLVWSPPWTIDRMSEAARLELGML